MAGVSTKKALGIGQSSVVVFPAPIKALRVPLTTDTEYEIGQKWIFSQQEYTYMGGGTWDIGGTGPASTTEYGTVLLMEDGTLAGADNTTVPTSLATKTYADNLAIAAAPVATTSTSGIGRLVSDANAVAQIPSTGTQAYFLQPSNIAAVMAAPGAIGGTTPAAGTFTDLTTSGTVNIIGDAAMLIDVAGAGIDVTLSSDAGRVVINAEEAAADALRISSAVGGLDLDVALGLDMVCSENAADAIILNATAGGIDITAAGAAGEDIDIVCTAGSVNITAGESAANSIVISSTIGGIDITCAGAAAGEDIDISSTGSSVNISASENTADAITINASAGGIDITNTGTAGEDIDIASSGASVNVSSTEDAALAIYLHANGGTSETIKIHSDQGTSSSSLDILSDVGGVSIVSGLNSSSAIVLNASHADGGVQVQAGTAGVLIGNQADAATLDLGNIAPTASRTITVGGGTVVTASVTDLIDIAPDGATTNADSIKKVTINDGGVTTGQLITDVATGAITSGTHTVNIQSGNAAAGTVALNMSTGTGTKTVSVGNADGLTTSGFLGPVNINVSQNNNVAINSGTSTGSLTLGNTAAGAVILNSGSTIAIGDASAGAVTVDTGAGFSIDGATASNLTAAAGDLTVKATTGSLVLNAEEAVDDAIQLTSAAGGLAASIALSLVLQSTETNADSLQLISAGGMDLTATGAATKDIDIACTSGSVNISAGEAVSDAIVISATNASGGITHTGKCIYTPDSITSDNAGVAASVSTVVTLITTDGDSNEDNVTVADGVAGQLKIFAVVVAGNAADSIKITPANMAGGTKITFAADPTGKGCSMIFDGTNWNIVSNNQGTIA